MISDKEKKKREEEAKLIISNNNIGDTINSINYANSNNYKINTNNDNEKEFINKINEANSIINSINPRQNIAAPSVSEEDSIKSRETAAEFLKAIDGNIDEIEEPNIANATQNIEEQPQASEAAREAVNVLMNKKKLSSYTTEDEKLQQQSAREQQVKRMEEANSDKNPLSQLGKAIENFWLGITSGGKSAAYYATETNHTKDQENELLASNKGGIANLEYKAQLNKPDLSLIKNNNTSSNNPLIYQKSTLEGPLQNNTSDFIRDEDKQRIDKELDKHKDAFGELELDPLRRELSKGISEDQNKIADNINRIDNGLIKKIAELTPSAGNSFAGAGLSVINPYLGMSYFIVSASGSYEFDGRNRGMSKEEARAYGSIMGFVEGATEYLEVSHFMPAQTNAIRTGSAIKFLKNVGLDMADNAVQEAIIDPIDEFVASSISEKGNYDLKTREGWKQLGNAMVEDAINGALSSILMGGINLNIGSCMKLYDNIKNGKNPTTNEWKAAFSDVQKSKKINIKEKFKEAFKYEKEKVANNRDIYTMTDMDNQGNIVGLTQTIGESIDLDNKELQVFPVVVYNDGYYNIIDGQSGLKLDTTLYESKQHAINSFKEKISKADTASINEINRQAVITQLVVADKFREMQEIAQQNPGEMQRQTRIDFVQDNKMYSTSEAQQILNDYGINTSVNNRQYIGQELNDMITNNMFEKLQLNETSKNNSNYMQNDKNNIQKSYTPEQYNNVKELLNEISDTTIYKKSDTIPILEYLKDNIGNVNLIEQSGNYYVNSLSEDGRVVYQQKVSNRPYTGKKLKEIVNTAIEKADYNASPEKPNTNTAHTSSDPNRSSFYTAKSNYVVEDIKKVTEPFNTKKEYTMDEMAEIWNNEISKNEYDVTYDNDGNIKSYIAIEENNGNLVVNQYDNEDNIVKSKAIPANKGKYTSKAIKDTLEKVSSIYDENRPIKRQQDIEGNEVRSLRKSSGKTITKENSALSYPTKDSDNKTVESESSIANSIPQNNDIIKSIQSFEKAKKVVNSQDIVRIAQALKIYHKGKTYINNSLINKSGNNKNTKITRISDFFSNYNDNEDLRKIALDYARKTYQGTVVKNRDTKTLIDISRGGLTKTFGTNRDNIKMQTAMALDLLIKESVYVNSSLHNTDENIIYHHYFAPIEYNDTNMLSMITIREIITDKSENHKFYYHDIRKIDNIQKELSQYLPQQNKLSNKFGEKAPNINNSIPQNKNSVKNDTAINKQSMQKSENNTKIADENIRSMKKSNSDIASRQNEEQKAIEKELHNRVQNAVLSKNSKKNTFLGIVSNKTVSKIKSLLGIDTSNRKHVLSDRDIRHMINQHGNQVIEEAKGQIAITSKDIEKIPDIINDYDEIVKGSQNRNRFTGEMQNSIRYIKQYDNNVLYVVEVVPDNSSQLDVKTMWKKAIDTTKKDNSVSVGHDNNNVLPDTSKTKPNSSYLDTSIAENTKNVKKDNITFAKRTAKDIKNEIDKTQRNAEREGNYIEQEIQKIEKTGKWDDTIPVTKLTDIRKTIEDYLGLNIKKGHFRQDAYAIYKGNRDVVRTREYKDMDSILHETGHALDIGNRLKIDKETLSTELITAIDKLGGYENETRTVRLEEGFAEVIREYSIIPEQAKMEYPQTVSVLEKLRQNDKNFNKFITKVQEQTYNYIHQNPRNRTLSNMSIGEQTDRTPLTKNWLKQEVMRNVWDKDYALKSAVETTQKANGKTINQLKPSDNAYYLTRLASGIGDKVVSMLSDGYIDINGNKLMPGLNQIGEILENDPQRVDDLRAYLIARRDTDYKAKTLKTGIRSTDSQAVIEQFKNDTKIQEAAKVIYDTLDGVMQYAVNNGLITQETSDKLKESNAFYVPMQRVLDNKGNQVGRRGAVADIIKKRTGSELDVKDILENIVANSSNIIQQVENNNVLKALYRQGEEGGLTGTIYDVIDTPMTKIGTAKLDTWTAELNKQGVDTSKLDLEKTIDLFAPNNKVDAQNLITNFIDNNGKRVYLQFNDELVFNSIMNMDKKFMSQVLKINSKMNMPLRYGATMANIGFAIPNMISDTAQAAIYSTAGFIPIVDNALGVLDVLATTNKTVGNFVNKVAPRYAERINQLYTIYSQTGATSSTRLSQYRKSTQSTMKDIYGTKNSKTLGIKESWKPLNRLLDILTYIPEISEQSTRFEVFKKNYNYYKNKGNSEMDTRIMAALESRDATQDFGRTGNITREINQLIPFSAARVGSAYTFAEKVKANPKQVGLRIAILTTLAIAIKGMGYDDDEIEELNQRKKDDNFVFKVGDSIVTIKKPQGILRSIVNLSEYIQDLSTGHIEEGKEGERLGEWLNNAIMDNMPADSVTGLVPNMVAPLIENAINKDFYYNTDIVKSYDLELPDKEQYYDYNSQLSIILGSIFNYSPAKIDNLISGYFGGLGTQVTNAMDYVMGKTGMTPEKTEMGAESNAIGKRFIVNVNSNSATIDDIYNRKTELTKKKNGGTITSEETAELKKITESLDNISNLNAQIKDIKKDLSLSGKEKAEQIKLLQQEKTDTARQALGKELINSSNNSKIQSTQFYPGNTLKKNNYTLTLTKEQKKEYEQIANEYYSKYKKQGLYSEEKLKDIKSKAKDYAKNKLMQKYKSSLIKTKK